MNKENIENATLDEQLAYKEYHLSSIMEKIIEVNPGFEKINEFKTGKGKERAVYMYSLLEGLSKESKATTPSLEAFTDLDGETWYPVLTQIKEGNAGPENAVYLINTYSTETEKEFVKAFVVDENGELVLDDDDFTELEFENESQSNSINQSYYTMSLVSCKPTYANEKEYTDCYGDGSGGSGGSTLPSTLHIERIEIRDKKESWIEKADIEFQGVKVSYTGSEFLRDYVISFSSSYVNLTGGREAVTKISNSELGTLQTVNFKIGVENQSSSFVFTLYEYDSWPAPKKHIKLSLLPGPCDCVRPDYDLFGYRSYQTPYFNRAYSLNRNSLTDGISNAFGRKVWSVEDNLSAKIEFTD